jgi:hypothetical protein
MPISLPPQTTAEALTLAYYLVLAAGDEAHARECRMFADDFAAKLDTETVEACKREALALLYREPVPSFA